VVTIFVTLIRKKAQKSKSKRKFASYRTVTCFERWWENVENGGKTEGGKIMRRKKDETAKKMRRGKL